MSLTQTVVKLIQQRAGRCATVDDLHPLLSSYTRGQVIAAMSNAKYQGLLSCDGHKPRQGKGVGRGSQGSVYRFIQKRQAVRHTIQFPPVNSVFALGYLPTPSSSRNGDGLKGPTA